MVKELDKELSSITLYENDEKAVDPLRQEWQECEKKNVCRVSSHSSKRSSEEILADKTNPFLPLETKIDEGIRKAKNKTAEVSRLSRNCESSLAAPSRMAFGEVETNLEKSKDNAINILDGHLNYTANPMESNDTDICGGAMKKVNNGLMSRYIYTRNTAGALSHQANNIIDTANWLFKHTHSIPVAASECEERLRRAYHEAGMAALTSGVDLLIASFDIDKAAGAMHAFLVRSEQQYKSCHSSNDQMKMLHHRFPSTRPKSSDVTGTEKTASSVTGTASSSAGTISPEEVAAITKQLSDPAQVLPGTDAGRQPASNLADLKAVASSSRQGSGVSLRLSSNTLVALEKVQALELELASRPQAAVEKIPNMGLSLMADNLGQENLQITPEIRAEFGRLGLTEERTIFQMVHSQYEKAAVHLTRSASRRASQARASGISFR